MTEFPPYTSSSLADGGLATWITRTALAREGWEINLAVLPWARALNEARQGKCDGVIGLWRSPEREEFLSFTQPLGITNRIGFMARAGTAIDVSDLGRMRGLTIGVVRDYSNPPAIQKARLKLDPAMDDLHNLRKLLAGRIDVVLIDKGVAFYLLQTQLLSGVSALAWLEPAVSESPLHSAFVGRSPQAQAGLAALNAGLTRIRNSGELAQMLQPFARWL